MPEATKTACAYCGVGCGVAVERSGDGVQVYGDDSHPANRGALCAKGAQLGATLDLEGRLLAPRADGGACDWDTALGRIAAAFGKARERYGPGAVAMYVSGQLLTEDYYVANKFMKGALASANIDTNSRLCMASSVVAYRRAFGADAVPCGYEDVETADLVILVGSNLAWCHPVLYRRLAAARVSGAGPVLVVVDPRRTATAADADLHLALRPGTDGDLFNGLLAWLDAEGHTDRAFVANHCEGYGDALAAAKRAVPAAAPGMAAATAARCGLGVADVEALFRLFAASDKVVSAWSQGVNQSSVGTDKANAIINVHLASGKIGRPGCGPFSITGQPNAMGGREVGGLATQLAAHMGFEAESADRVRRFWGFDQVAERPGLAAVQLFDAVGRGDVKALWILGTNPAVSMPAAGRVREALAACEFLAVSDCVAATDTARYADVLLPALGWGEKDGACTNSERCISRQRAFLPAPGEARPDWWAIAEVAKRMGHGSAFDYPNAAAVFREHAALSAFENDGRRAFDIGALSRIDDAGYDALPPTYWPCPANGFNARRPVDLFAGRRYYTASGRACFVPVTSAGSAQATDADYPLLLNSGRVRDQWHTMTRSAKAPALNRHAPEPRLYLHALDARRYGIADGRLARVSSRHGSARLRVSVSRSVLPGQAFLPMHWSDANSSSVLSGVLFAGACDPHSLQPELKVEPVRVTAEDACVHGIELCHTPGPLPRLPAEASYHVETRLDGCTVRFLGFDDADRDWQAWAVDRVGAAEEIVSVAGDRVMQAAITGGRLAHVVLLARAPCHRDVHWLAGLFTEPSLGIESRRALVRGSPAKSGRTASTGEIVCACFGTTRDGVRELATLYGARDAAQVAAMSGAGSNCGSCLPEVRELLDQAPEDVPAARAAG